MSSKLAATRCKARVSIDNGKLKITSLREEPRETIEIDFNDLSLVSSFGLLDDGELELVGSEAERLIQSLRIQNSQNIDSSL